MKPLSLIRPKVLSKMIGQEGLMNAIRGRAKKHRLPKAWLLIGDSGLGKTTLARILAVSYQCKHQKYFGEPCLECTKAFSRREFPIFELDIVDQTGVDELRKFLSDSEREFLGKGERRVYILDECHLLSKRGLSLLLKYLEDASNKTIWILCSTESHLLLKTVRRRCAKYALKPLSTDEVLACVKYFLALAKSDRNSDEITDALITRQIDSPGFIAQAVDKYASGESAEKAADIEASTDVDTLPLSIAVSKGDWSEVSQILQSTNSSDARGIRAAVVGLLRKQLLETDQLDTRNKVLADCICKLCYMPPTDNLIIMSALTSELYKLCMMFNRYKR